MPWIFWIATFALATLVGAGVSSAKAKKKRDERGRNGSR